jgi:D-3-phosphoglycerate dehydrogenase
MKIFATSNEFGSFTRKKIEEYLNPLKIDIHYNKDRGPINEKDFLEIDPNYEAIIAYSSHDIITSKVLDHFSKLKIIARHGIGYDAIDINAARERGIIVTNTHDGAYEERAVSDLAITFTLALARDFVNICNLVKSGKWNRPVTKDLYGKTMGIVGTGRIGKMTAVKAKCFGMKVIAFDINQDEKFAKENQISYVSLDELLRESDFISLHCPLTEDNLYMIGAEEIAKMKRGSFLINCARGALVDEEALYEALKSGRIGGAGIDVFQKEPPRDNPLLTLPNVLATSHVGAYTEETITAMDLLAVKACADVLLGKRPSNIVNDQVEIRSSGNKK